MLLLFVDSQTIYIIEIQKKRTENRKRQKNPENPEKLVKSNLFAFFLVHSFQIWAIYKVRHTKSATVIAFCSHYIIPSATLCHGRKSEEQHKCSQNYLYFKAFINSQIATQNRSLAYYYKINFSHFFHFQHYVEV